VLGDFLTLIQRDDVGTSVPDNGCHSESCYSMLNLRGPSRARGIGLFDPIDLRAFRE
jgi:hypothetical protein